MRGSLALKLRSVTASAEPTPNPSVNRTCREEPRQAGYFVGHHYLE
jgi:hypothetical protein